MTAIPRTDTTAMLMAGGVGNRLYPLTRDRAKPAVPFGALYRIIDFTLSNCLNSGIYRINVLTQYRSHSLHRHIREAWSALFNSNRGEYVEAVPPQQRVVGDWYRGTADAIFQNVYSLEMERPRYVLILSGDHIYRMDYSAMVDAHVERGAELTIACLEVPRPEATRLGVLEVDEDERIIGFAEKPAEPKPVPDDPDTSLASMGVYVFSTDTLVRVLSQDARTDSDHDFGKNIIPNMVAAGMGVYAYRFRDPDTGARGFWRDIGTIDSFFDANLEMLQPNAPFDLHDADWPVHTFARTSPPAKTIDGGDGSGCSIANSLLAPGSIVAGGCVERSLLSPRVVVGSGAEIRESMLFSNVQVGRGARIRRAIIDKHVRVPDGFEIGYDAAADRRRFTVSANGVVVIPKGMILD